MPVPFARAPSPIPVGIPGAGEGAGQLLLPGTAEIPVPKSSLPSGEGIGVPLGCEGLILLSLWEQAASQAGWRTAEKPKNKINP